MSTRDGENVTAGHETWDDEEALRETVQRGTVLDLTNSEPKRKIVRSDAIRRLVIDFANDRQSRVALWGATLSGALSLSNLSYASSIELIDCEFDDAVSFEALSCYRIEISGSRVNAPFTARGAQTVGDLWLPGTSFRSTITLDRVTVGGDLLARHSDFARGLSVYGARISGSLDLRGSTLGEGRPSLMAEHLDVRRDALLNEGFQSAGQLWLVAASVAGTLTMTGARIGSLQATNLVAGDLALRGHARVGDVVMIGARVERDVDFEAAEMLGELDMRSVRCQTLVPTWKSAPSRIRLAGLRFDDLESPRSTSLAKDGWLRRASDGDWSPTIYETYARALETSGDELGARRVRIAQGDDERRHLKAVKGTAWYRLWRATYRAILGYGYQRWRVGVGLVVLVLFAATASRVAYDHDVLADGEIDAVPSFNSFAYGVDLVVPVLDLGQADRWVPDPEAKWGAALQVTWWIVAALGWSLSTLFVIAFTNLLRRY